MFRTLTLKAQLATLAVAVALPLAGAFAWRTFAERDARVREAEQTSLTFAMLARSRFEVVLVDSKQALEHLAARDDVVAGAACPQALREAHGLLPQFNVISRNRADGVVLCSSPRLPAGTSIARLPWRPSGHQGLAISPPLTGPVTRRRIAILSVPVERGDGWVTASLDLDRLDPGTRSFGLPEGAVVSVFDRNGILIARQPSRADLVGRAFPQHPLVRAARTRLSSHRERTGHGGATAACDQLTSWNGRRRARRRRCPTMHTLQTRCFAPWDPSRRISRRRRGRCMRVRTWCCYRATPRRNVGERPAEG